MHLRDSFVLSSLLVVTACPASPDATTDPGTSDPTAATEAPSTGTTVAPTTGGPDSTSGTTAGPDDTTGASSSDTGGTSDGTGTDTDTDTTGDPPALPETCADVLAGDPGAGDGEYTLYVGKAADKPWPAYCHDMAGTPAEYLVLVNVAPGRNFSQYTAVEDQRTDVVTSYTRVRIDPVDLVVDIDDGTFSSSTGMLTHGNMPVTSMPYAIAEGCGGPDEAVGIGNVDLVGTPFRVKDMFCTKGATAAGNAAFSMGAQVVDLTGGGFCGWTGPTKGNDCVSDPQNKDSGFVLELEYLPFLPETCAEVKAKQPDAPDGDYTLYIEGKESRAWAAYCHDMAGTPREYLPLANVGGDYNFSEYATDGPGTTVRTQFTRVRLDPKTLVIDIDDVTFSESTGQLMHGQTVITSMPYAIAESCDGPGMANGAANIDLVGTVFNVVDTFCTAGASSAGDAVFSAYDQVVDLAGGGNCGWTGPSKAMNSCVSDPQNKSSGFVLELAYFNF
jgi:hypothetical protein